MCLSVNESVFLPLYLLNEWMYLSETDHSLSIPDPHDSDDIEKVKVGQQWP